MDVSIPSRIGWRLAIFVWDYHLSMKKWNEWLGLFLKGHGSPQEKRQWEGVCPVCGRFQHSPDVCSDCFEDGWEHRASRLDEARLAASAARVTRE
tara:strand:+ start:298 stop:582 length:285 start_codon:yes stop_codon:yes gene_type:complete